MLLFGSVFVSFFISFVHFYITKLEPIAILTPESLRNQLITTSSFDRYFFDFHSPTHLNTGNYFIGILIGYFYYQYKKSGQRHRRNIFLHGLWHLSYITTFVLCYIGIYFYENDIEKGFLSAILGAVLKHIYGPVFGVLLLGIFFRYGFYTSNFFNFGAFRILARMSFCVYMVHLSIGSLFITAQKFPLEVNNATLGAYFGAVYLTR